MSEQTKPGFSRRDFLKTGTTQAAVVATSAVAVQSIQLKALAALKAQQENPYEYKVDAYLKTDPKWLHYQVAAEFTGLGEAPRRIATGPESQIYVTSGKRVQLLDQAGRPLRHFEAADIVRCLAVDANGNVAVGLKSQVELFDAKGARVGGWKQAGDKAWFTGVAWAEQDVLVADAGSRILWRYDRAGKLLGRIGEKRSDPPVPGLICPSPFCDVEVGKDGLIRLTNTGRHQVEVYTLKGELEFAWGQPAVGIEGFCGCCNPVNIALLPDGRVVTCEKGLLRVKVYGERGGLESVVLGPESFPSHAKLTAWQDQQDGSMAGLDAAVDAGGRILVLDQISKTIKVMVRKTV